MYEKEINVERVKINAKRLILALKVASISSLAYFLVNIVRYYQGGENLWTIKLLLLCNVLGMCTAFSFLFINEDKLANNKRYTRIGVYLYLVVCSILVYGTLVSEYYLTEGLIIPFIYIICMNILFYFKPVERVVMNITFILVLLIVIYFLQVNEELNLYLFFSFIMAGIVSHFYGVAQFKLWQEGLTKSLELSKSNREQKKNLDSLRAIIDDIQNSLQIAPLGGEYNLSEEQVDSSVLLIHRVRELVDSVILEKKKAEKNLNDYNDLFNNSYDAFTYLNADGLIVDANRAFKQLTGYDVKGGEVLHIKDIVHPEDTEKSHEYLRKLIKDGGYKGYEGRIINKDGTISYIEVSSKAIYDDDGQIVGSKDIIRDISEKKAAEIQIRKQLELDQMQNKVSELFLKGDDGAIDADIQKTLSRMGRFFNVDRCYIFSIDQELDTMTATQEWCAEGVPPEIDNLKNLPLSEFQWWAQNMLNKKIIKIEDVDGLKETDPPLYQLLAPQGIKSLLCVPMIFKGETKGFLGFDDVRQNRNWSESAIQLLKKSAEIFISITENHRINSEKQALIYELARKNDELADFAHIVSHDLKAPLRGMLTLINWLKDDLGDQMTQKILENMDLIEDRALRMENLINDILSYSSLDHHEDTTNVDMTKLFKDIEANLSSPNRSFKVNYAGNFPVLQRYSTTRLYQLFQNLMANAINYSDKDMAEVTISYKLVKGNHEFTVADNGVGIDEKFSKKIFEIFQKLDNKNPASTGIGLAIVKKIVQMYNGAIDLESKVGMGSKFIVTLPRIGS